MSTTTTLSIFESHLWEAANILRGSPVDRTDWKSYILPLMFFKWICDVWDEEFEETVKTYGEDFDDEHRFQVPEENRWNDVREKASTVGAALQNAMREIEATNRSTCMVSLAIHNGRTKSTYPTHYSKICRSISSVSTWETSKSARTLLVMAMSS